MSASANFSAASFTCFCCLSSVISLPVSEFAYRMIVTQYGNPETCGEGAGPGARSLDFGPKNGPYLRAAFLAASKFSL